MQIVITTEVSTLVNGWATGVDGFGLWNMRMGGIWRRTEEERKHGEGII